MPNKELLKFSLKRMFDQPRNMWQSPKFREHVGSYIFERLARAGLVVTIHDFKHEAPLKKFAESQGDFGVPVRFPVHIIMIGIVLKVRFHNRISGNQSSIS